MPSELTLRRLLAEPGLVRAVGARDGLTARLVAAAGFDALWLSSLELSAARALPDMGLLTLTECVDAVRIVSEATSLPLLVDCDTGFGGAKNVARTVAQLEAAGASGMCIEDKVFPKRNSFLDSGHVLERAEEFAGRLRLARQVRRNEEFVIVARCEAYIAGLGRDEVLRRCHLYVDGGADAVLVHSKASTSDEVEHFLRGWGGRAPVVVVPTTYGSWTVADAQAAGVSMAIYANQTLRASVAATEKVLQAMFESGTADSSSVELSSVKRIFELTDVEHWDQLGALT